MKKSPAVDLLGQGHEVKMKKSPAVDLLVQGHVMVEMLVPVTGNRHYHLNFEG